MSRYGIDTDLLRQAALNLQIGAGIADRLKTAEAEAFVTRAEDWVEAQVEAFIATPIQPTRAPGDIALDLDNLTYRNYPVDFVHACVYRAVSLLLTSEYFENAPNKSEAGVWADKLTWDHISQFRSRSTTRVGAGRRRNPNPFIPPQIAPPEQIGQAPPGMGQG